MISSPFLAPFSMTSEINDQSMRASNLNISYTTLRYASWQGLRRIAVNANWSVRYEKFLVLDTNSTAVKDVCLGNLYIQ